MATIEETIMQDAPASADTTYTMAVGDAFEGIIEDSSDVDWIRVELVAGRRYDIRLESVGPDGVVDPLLRIMDTDGTEIARNDDVDTHAQNLNSMLDFSPDSTGVYYISAGSFQSPYLGFSGRYRVTVHDEEDDNPDTPYAVSVGGRFEGTLDDKFDEDWVRVELVEGTTYHITLSGIGPDADTDTILRIYNSDGEQVAFHDDVDYAAGKVHSRLAFSPAATGTYYLGAGAYRGNPTQDNSGQYQLAVYDEEQSTGMIVAGTGGNDVLEDKLVGGPGDDELDGGEGNDWLEGGAGADRLRGGEGSDVAWYVYSDAAVEVRLHDRTARGGHAEGDIFAGRQTIVYVDAEGEKREMDVPDIEHLFGSVHDDILVGTRGVNALFGYYGDDELDGRGGNDWLAGGPGADAFRGGDGFDAVSYGFSDAGVEVRLYDGTARGGDAEGDTFPGRKTIEYVDAAGETQTADVADIELLDGSDHDDVLAGDRGNDRIEGSLGNDLLDGREGDDTLVGQGGADRLIGGPGDDILEGGAGNDLLRGGPGSDSLEGGEGDDTFHFAPRSGDDIVLDFGNGEDRMDLSAFTDIQSLADLDTEQQEGHLVIDLSAHGGGAITLQGFDMPDVLETQFVFFMDESMIIASH